MTDLRTEDAAARLDKGPRQRATHEVLSSVGASFATELSDLLVSTYGSIDAIESKMLHDTHGLDISIAECRLIDIVGRATLRGSGKITVSEIADALGVRRPSATAGVNRLVTKGFFGKTRSERDARRVNVSLTRAGERVYRLHAIFHRRMAEAVAGDMTPEEREVLLKGVRRLDDFYAQAREA